MVEVVVVVLHSNCEFANERREQGSLKKMMMTRQKETCPQKMAMRNKQQHKEKATANLLRETE